MAKVNLTCMECGKNFKVSDKANDPRCPKCGSVDWEVTGEVFINGAFNRKVRYRNYSNGPWDLMPEGAY